MMGPRSDLPLSDNPAVRILPWIVALMVYLATLTLAGGLLVGTMANQWSQGLSGTLTVQVAPLKNESLAELDARVIQATRAILKTPGVKSAAAIPLRDIAVMLEPWLGGEANVKGLPLPRLIDVALNPDIDLQALAERLRKATPGAEIDNHQYWRDHLITFLRSLEIVAAIMVLLIAITTATIVVFATRSGLAVHREVIEVLHLIGAPDAYIAGQFQRHAQRLGFIGGAAGGVLGLATLLGLSYLAGNLDGVTLPALHLWHWPILAALPIAAAYIAKWTARRIVLRALNRMA
jgi:cell division transport system permease protein